MKGSLKLVSVAGIGIFVHWTFSLLLAFIVYMTYRSGGGLWEMLWATIFVLTLFVIVVMHELGHALTAKRYGINTQDITLLPIGGMARLESIPEKPSEELVVAIAGPLVNIALALLLFPFVNFPADAEAWQAMASSYVPENFLFNLFFVNVLLAVFNMIPAFPMDGGRVFRAILAMTMDRTKATFIAARVGQFIAAGFVLVGLFGNLVLALIGVFIFMGAQTEAQFTQAKSILVGFRVKDVLMKDYHTLGVQDNIQVAVDQLLNGQAKNFLVTDNLNKPVGTLGREEIIKALSEQGENATIQQVMNEELAYLEVNEPLEQVYQKAQQYGSRLMPVMENGQLVGVLDMENVMEFIMVKGASKRSL